MKPLKFEHRSIEEMKSRSYEFLELMSRRRSVRDFSDKSVPEILIKNAIATAASAPSGANMQPWHFSMVRNAEIKRQIREAAEAEERKFYTHRASDEWLDSLKPLGTDAHKPFIEIAPWLIVIFSRKFTLDENGDKRKHYYTPESVGIATGLLIASLHNAGLATLTHTPSPMGFLRDILKRPRHEKPFLILVAGYPAENTRVPDIHRLPLDEVVSQW